MSKKIITVVVVVLLLAVGGFVGYKFMTKGPKPEPPKVKMIVKAGDFFTNLAGGDKRFIKVQIDVEAESEETGAELVAKASQVRDQILSVLRSKTASELQGPDGMRGLSQSLVDKINQILTSGKVLNVYFIEFAIQ